MSYTLYLKASSHLVAEDLLFSSQLGCFVDVEEDNWYLFFVCSVSFFLTPPTAWELAMRHFEQL